MIHAKQPAVQLVTPHVPTKHAVVTNQPAAHAQMKHAHLVLVPAIA